MGKKSTRRSRKQKSKARTKYIRQTDPKIKDEVRTQERQVENVHDAPQVENEQALSQSKYQQTTSSATATVYILVLLIIVAGFIGFEHFFTYQTYMWKESKCTILECNTTAKHKTKRDRHNQSYTSSTHSANMTYTFKFKGYQHFGHLYDLSSWYSKSEYTNNGVNRICNKYSAGTTHTCYINPDTTGESVIARGMPLVIQIFWLVFIALFAYLLLQITRNIKQSGDVAV